MTEEIKKRDIRRNNKRVKKETKNEKNTKGGNNIVKNNKPNNDLDKKQSKTRRTYNRKNSKTNKKEEGIFKKSKLKIIPLGGIQEIGKNITVFEYEDEMVVVDCGLSFPDDDMLGVDLVIPDITYLKRN